MKPIIFSTIFFSSHFLFGQDSFQLARPLAKFESLFFKDSATLELKFAQQGARIYYTLNRRKELEPIEPTPGSQLYKNPLVFKSSLSIIKAKVFQNGYKPSETIELSFARQGLQIKKLTGTKPNSKYPGSGDSTLFDNKGGIVDPSSKTWMGFDQDTVHLEVELSKTEKLNTILLSFLQNQGSWIFLPEMISVYYFDEKKNAYHPFGREILLQDPTAPAKMNFRFIRSRTGMVKTNKLVIDLVTVRNIPAWHPAKGQHAWCFIDEIKIY